LTKIKRERKIESIKKTLKILRDKNYYKQYTKVFQFALNEKLITTY